MPVDFCRHLVGKTGEKCFFFTVIAFKYTLLVSQWWYGQPVVQPVVQLVQPVVQQVVQLVLQLVVQPVVQPAVQCKHGAIERKQIVSAIALYAVWQLSTQSTTWHHRLSYRQRPLLTYLLQTTPLKRSPSRTPRSTRNTTSLRVGTVCIRCKLGMPVLCKYAW